MVKKGLGNGLGALFGDANPITPTEPKSAPGERVLQVKLADITANPDQPRRRFDEGKLKELAASIKEQGVLQPILLRPVGHGKYEIVAGERRFRASQLAGLQTIPAIVKELGDEVTLAVALIENIQRQELNPLEEAASYRELIDNYGYTQAKLAEKLGKSRVYVANTLRLLALPADIQSLISKGSLTAGHGRALLMLEGTADRLLLAARVQEEGLSVRQTEALAKDPKALHKAAKKPADPAKLKLTPPQPAPADELLLNEVGEQLRQRLQTKVSVQRVGKAHGKITLEYFGDEELERIISLLLPNAKF